MSQRFIYRKVKRGSYIVIDTGDIELFKTPAEYSLSEGYDVETLVVLLNQLDQKNIDLEEEIVKDISF